MSDLDKICAYHSDSKLPIKEVCLTQCNGHNYKCNVHIPKKDYLTIAVYGIKVLRKLQQKELKKQK